MALLCEFGTYLTRGQNVASEGGGGLSVEVRHIVRARQIVNQGEVEEKAHVGRVASSGNQSREGARVGGWVGGWMDGWMDGGEKTLSGEFQWKGSRGRHMLQRGKSRRPPRGTRPLVSHSVPRPPPRGTRRSQPASRQQMTRAAAAKRKDATRFSQSYHIISNQIEIQSDSISAPLVS